MARIAVAGGAGAVGRTFVEALSKTKHQVIVLSRSERQSDFSNVKYVKVDYSDVNSMTIMLMTNIIDTVISAITMDNSGTSQAQLNLIAAAKECVVTKRFIPSEFGVIANAETSELDPYCKFWLESAEALAKTDLQYTRISVGSLMDWWGMPHIKTTLSPFTWAIDIENGVAAIPGTGNERLSLTYTYDLAKFIMRLLDEPGWPELCAVVGQDITFNKMLEWAEIATGRKFQVSYDSIEKLQRGEVTPLSGFMASSQFLSEATRLFGIMVVKDYLLMPEEQGFRLNERFPDLEVLTVEAMIRESWTKERRSG